MSKEKFQKYIISLDAVDVSLLPINYYSKFDNVAPLWTRNNLDMRNNEYYEFEIKNVDSKLEDNLEDEIINIPCHICNIEVPVPFLKQHIDSFKHIINMKIADMAVERLKKSMRHQNLCNQETYPTLHFCPACVTVIKLKDRTCHEKTIAHKNSLLVNKFLNDFYLLYTNDTDCKSDDVNLNENIDEFNDQDLQRTHVSTDNVERSMDSVSFKSATDSGSIFKESDQEISDKNKKNNDDIKTNEIKNENNTPVNVFKSVEDKTILENASNKTPCLKKEENIKKKKAKAKNNAGINQDLVAEHEKIQNVRQSPVSLSSSDDNITGEASKIDAEFRKVEKGNTKKSKKKSKQVIQEDDRSTDSLSLFADDVKKDDAFDNSPEFVKIENSKAKKSKIEISQEIVQISKEQKHIASSVETLSLSKDYITAQDTSSVLEVNKTENIKTKKSKKRQEVLEISTQSKDNRPTDSLFIVSTKESSTKVLEISKAGEKQTDAQMKNKTAEINTDQDVLCKICNNNKDQDHSVCTFLWNEYCERFDTDVEILDVFTNLHYHLVMKSCSPYCMVCKCNFYGGIDVIDHLLSEEHVNRYNMLLCEQYLVLDDDLTTCKVCGITFKKEFELLHCENIKHITKHEKFKRQLSKTNA